MSALTKLIPALLYIVVGITSMMMAYRSIFSTKFIFFHEQAAGKSWNEIDKGIQSVVLTLMKVAGLGFLVVAFLLLIFPIVNYFEKNLFIQYAIPIISLFYCLGLSLFNYQLYDRTKAKTPWKRSLYAAMFVGFGLIISFLS